MSSAVAASVFVDGAWSEATAAAAARQVREILGRPARCAFAFTTPDYADHLEAFCETIRVDGHIRDVVGCTAPDVIGNKSESGEDGGFSLLALDCENTDFHISTLSQQDVESSTGREWWKNRLGSVSPSTWLAFANPYSFAADAWLSEWNAAFPGIPCLGGLAGGLQQGEKTSVFYNGKIHDAVVIGISGALEVLPSISPACRPIGEPLTVTKAEDNIVYSLGAHPAYEALESAYQTLSDAEKSRAQGNLFAGLAGTEYVEDFKPGDFLVRNILGADPDSGAVMIAGIPRVGQTLQYQLRDRDAADAGLRDSLKRCPLGRRKPLGALLFSCLGRGSEFFGNSHHDADALGIRMGGKPLAGFYGNGEIGPVSTVNCLHGYTAACAIFVEKFPVDPVG